MTKRKAYESVSIMILSFDEEDVIRTSSFADEDIDCGNDIFDDVFTEMKY